MKLRNDVTGYKGNVYGKKGEEIIIISTSGHVHVVENVLNKDRYGVHNNLIDFSECEIIKEASKEAPLKAVPVVPPVTINNSEKQASTKKRKVASPTNQQNLF